MGGANLLHRDTGAVLGLKCADHKEKPGSPNGTSCRSWGQEEELTEEVHTADGCSGDLLLLFTAHSVESPGEVGVSIFLDANPHHGESRPMFSPARSRLLPSWFLGSKKDDASLPRARRLSLGFAGDFPAHKSSPVVAQEGDPVARVSKPL